MRRVSSEGPDPARGRAPDLATGTVLADRYVLMREGWGTPLGPVWLARDRVLNRPVAVQTLSPRAAARASVRKAFRRAAALAGQASHPALLQVYDIGEDPTFAVFELPAGGRLKERLDAGPLLPADAARIALALARGLEALHERGGSHGWLAPETVLIDEEGRPKLGAVGVAAAVRGVSELESSLGSPPGYRTPESNPLPADADRFALAALAYHMLTGRPPGRPPAPARSLRRAIPLAVERLLAQALDRDPSRRPGFDQFERALAPLARIEPPRVREPAFVRSEFRWLVPVLLIVGLGVAAVLVGTRISIESRPSSGARRPPAPRPIEVESVRDFDPLGNGQENSDEVGRAVDGNALTAWRTVGYKTANLGGKKGVGLVFDLGATRPVARIRVRSTLPGWTAEWRVAGAEGSRADDYRLATTFTASEDTTIPVQPAARGRYFLLWITKAADDRGGSEFPYRAFVSEVEFFTS